MDTPDGQKNQNELDNPMAGQKDGPMGDLETKERTVLPMKGLPASGLNCYSNSVLHVLAQIPGLTEALLECDGKKGPVTSTLLEILLDMNAPRHEEGDIVPEELIDQLRDLMSQRDPSFIKWNQNDSHSYLVCLMNAVKEELPDNPLEFLEGQLKTSFQYSTCKHTEESASQLFSTLLLPIEQDKFSVEDGFIILRNHQEHYDSTLPCSQCQLDGRNFDNTVTRSRLVLENPPKILILHLARFKENQNHDGYRWLEKIQDPMYYEAVVDLTDLCQTDGGQEGTDVVVYKLFGIISHEGTLEDGHYIAHVRRNPKSQWEEATEVTWYRCVNESVRPCTGDEYMKNPHAYLMFYERATI